MALHIKCGVPFLNAYKISVDAIKCILMMKNNKEFKCNNRLKS